MPGEGALQRPLGPMLGGITPPAMEKAGEASPLSSPVPRPCPWLSPLSSQLDLEGERGGSLSSS